jgi:ion channel-forming bestrophin family protein
MYWPKSTHFLPIHLVNRQHIHNQLRTGLNLIVAFAIALKHRLRFEPYTAIYKDLEGFVDHLETFAGTATRTELPTIPEQNGWWQSAGLYLGLPFAESNPQKIIKNSDMPLGNLPLEILAYIAAFLDHMAENGQLKVPMQQTVACEFFYD